MADIEVLIEKLDEARRNLNDARNSAEEWRRGKVAGVTHTAPQNTALRARFLSGITAAKRGIAAVEAELKP
ncbi:MAG: hypothetical protein J3T61_07130 [Candidatus Brocadiales bacterium]|nr:hypothetical protein [Candidatus Bathyanammoxibius sp.]